MIVTVAQRKAQAIDRLRAASIAATGELRTFASAHGGRYVVFGSFARGDIAPTSDFDVMVDFPGALEGEARDFAEEVCHRSGLKPDVHMRSEVSAQLMLRVTRDGVPLS